MSENLIFRLNHIIFTNMSRCFSQNKTLSFSKHSCVLKKLHRLFFSISSSLLKNSLFSPFYALEGVKIKC